MTDPDVIDLQLRMRELEARVAALEGSAPADFTPGKPTVDPEIQRLLQEGNKIAAIKRYREQTGASLGEAQQAVERIALGFSPT